MEIFIEFSHRNFSFVFSQRFAPISPPYTSNSNSGSRTQMASNPLSHAKLPLSPPERALLRFGNRNARVRLFCIHHAGGNANVFRPWPRFLPDWIEVFAFELPGHGCRSTEPACTSVDALLDGMLPVVRPYLDRPFALFGHSMGALLASELSHRLAHAGGSLPVHLFVAGLPAPHLLERRESVLHLSRAQLLRRLEELEGTPPEVFQHEELLDVVLPIIRNDFLMIERYEPRAARSLPLAISAFAGEREKISPAQLDAWSEYTSIGLNKKRLPGGHFFVTTATAELLELITRALEAQGLPG